MSQVSVFAMLFTFASLHNCQGAPITRHSPTVSPLPPSSNSNSKSTLTKTIVPAARVLGIRATVLAKHANGKAGVLPTTQACNSSDPVLSSSIIGGRKLFSEKRYFLQITKDGEVNGIDDDKSPTVELELESVGPGLIRIRGKEANLYLSMDSEGRLTAKKPTDRDLESVFKRIPANDGFFAFRSNKYCTKFIGMKRTGLLKRGHKVNQKHHSTHFLELN